MFVRAAFAAPEPGYVGWETEAVFEVDTKNKVARVRIGRTYTFASGESVRQDSRLVTIPVTDAQLTSFLNTLINDAKNAGLIPANAVTTIQP